MSSVEQLSRSLLPSKQAASSTSSSTEEEGVQRQHISAQSGCCKDEHNARSGSSRSGVLLGREFLRRQFTAYFADKLDNGLYHAAISYLVFRDAVLWLSVFGVLSSNSQIPEESNSINNSNSVNNHNISSPAAFPLVLVRVTRYVDAFLVSCFVLPVFFVFAFWRDRKTALYVEGSCGKSLSNLLWNLSILVVLLGFFRRMVSVLSDDFDHLEVITSLSSLTVLISAVFGRLFCGSVCLVAVAIGKAVSASKKRLCGTSDAKRQIFPNKQSESNVLSDIKNMASSKSCNFRRGRRSAEDEGGRNETDSLLYNADLSSNGVVGNSDINNNLGNSFSKSSKNTNSIISKIFIRGRTCVNGIKRRHCSCPAVENTNSNSNIIPPSGITTIFKVFLNSELLGFFLLGLALHGFLLSWDATIVQWFFVRHSNRSSFGKGSEPLEHEKQEVVNGSNSSTISSARSASLSGGSQTTTNHPGSNSNGGNASISNHHTEGDNNNSNNFQATPLTLLVEFLLLIPQQFVNDDYNCRSHGYDHYSNELGSTTKDQSDTAQNNSSHNSYSNTNFTITTPSITMNNVVPIVNLFCAVKHVLQFAVLCYFSLPYILQILAPFVTRQLIKVFPFHAGGNVANSIDINSSSRIAIYRRFGYFFGELLADATIATSIRFPEHHQYRAPDTSIVSSSKEERARNCSSTQTLEHRKLFSLTFDDRRNNVNDVNNISSNTNTNSNTTNISTVITTRKARRSLSSSFSLSRVSMCFFRFVSICLYAATLAFLVFSSSDTNDSSTNDSNYSSSISDGESGSSNTTINSNRSGSSLIIFANTSSKSYYIETNNDSSRLLTSNDDAPTIPTSNTSTYFSCSSFVSEASCEKMQSFFIKVKVWFLTNSKYFYYNYINGMVSKGKLMLLFLSSNIVSFFRSSNSYSVVIISRVLKSVAINLQVALFLILVSYLFSAFLYKFVDGALENIDVGECECDTSLPSNNSSCSRNYTNSNLLSIGNNKGKDTSCRGRVTSSEKKNRTTNNKNSKTKNASLINSKSKSNSSRSNATTTITNTSATNITAPSSSKLVPLSRSRELHRYNRSRALLQKAETKKQQQHDDDGKRNHDETRKERRRFLVLTTAFDDERCTNCDTSVSAVGRKSASYSGSCGMFTSLLLPSFATSTYVSYFCMVTYFPLLYCVCFLFSKIFFVVRSGVLFSTNYAMVLVNLVVNMHIRQREENNANSPVGGDFLQSQSNLAELSTKNFDGDLIIGNDVENTNSTVYNNYYYTDGTRYIDDEHYYMNSHSSVENNTKSTLEISSTSVIAYISTILKSFYNSIGAKMGEACYNIRSYYDKTIDTNTNMLIVNEYMPCLKYGSCILFEAFVLFFLASLVQTLVIRVLGYLFKRFFIPRTGLDVACVATARASGAGGISANNHDSISNSDDMNHSGERNTNPLTSDTRGANNITQNGTNWVETRLAASVNLDEVASGTCSGMNMLKKIEEDEVSSIAGITVVDLRLKKCQDNICSEPACSVFSNYRKNICNDSSFSLLLLDDVCGNSSNNNCSRRSSCGSTTIVAGSVVGSVTSNNRKLNTIVDSEVKHIIPAAGTQLNPYSEVIDKVALERNSPLYRHAVIQIFGNLFFLTIAISVILFGNVGGYAVCLAVVSLFVTHRTLLSIVAQGYFGDPAIASGEHYIKEGIIAVPSTSGGFEAELVSKGEQVPRVVRIPSVSKQSTIDSEESQPSALPEKVGSVEQGPGENNTNCGNLSQVKGVTGDNGSDNVSYNNSTENITNSAAVNSNTSSGSDGPTAPMATINIIVASEEANSVEESGSSSCIESEIIGNSSTNCRSSSDHTGSCSSALTSSTNGFLRSGFRKSSYSERSSVTALPTLLEDVAMVANNSNGSGNIDDIINSDVLDSIDTLSNVNDDCHININNEMFGDDKGGHGYCFLRDRAVDDGRMANNVVVQLDDDVVVDDDRLSDDGGDTNSNSRVGVNNNSHDGDNITPSTSHIMVGNDVGIEVYNSEEDAGVECTNNVFGHGTTVTTVDLTEKNEAEFNERFGIDNSISNTSRSISNVSSYATNLSQCMIVTNEDGDSRAASNDISGTIVNNANCAVKKCAVATAAPVNSTQLLQNAETNCCTSNIMPAEQDESHHVTLTMDSDNYSNKNSNDTTTTRRSCTNDRAFSTSATRDLFPFVLVQLPFYNEESCCQRLIQYCSAFEYPRDRFMIQVLDDSVDRTGALSLEEIRKQKFEKKDLLIEYKRRPDRDEFKAGALKWGMAEFEKMKKTRNKYSTKNSDDESDESKSRRNISLSTEEDYLTAIFDADFMPDSDFLSKLVGHFVADKSVGAVQARCGHSNRDQSWLTRGQACLLDSHFLNEHLVRFWLGFFFNFNGTCGIWRASCIHDAGGWDGRTLTEDLDLSFRAQLRDWKLIFRPDVLVYGELPDTVRGFKTQQFRWAKGAMQSVVFLIPEIVRKCSSTGGRISDRSIIFAGGRPSSSINNCLHSPSLRENTTKQYYSKSASKNSLESHGNYTKNSNSLLKDPLLENNSKSSDLDNNSNKCSYLGCLQALDSVLYLSANVAYVATALIFVFIPGILDGIESGIEPGTVSFDFAFGRFLRERDFSLLALFAVCVTSTAASLLLALIRNEYFSIKHNNENSNTANRNLNTSSKKDNDNSYSAVDSNSNSSYNIASISGTRKQKISSSNFSCNIFTKRNFGFAKINNAVIWIVYVIRLGIKFGISTVYALTVGGGLALNNTRAVFEAILGHKTAFIRTPKTGSGNTSRSDRSSSRSNDSNKFRDSNSISKEAHDKDSGVTKVVTSNIIICGKNNDALSLVPAPTGNISINSKSPETSTTCTSSIRSGTGEKKIQHITNDNSVGGVPDGTSNIKSSSSRAHSAVVVTVRSHSRCNNADANKMKTTANTTNDNKYENTHGNNGTNTHHCTITFSVSYKIREDSSREMRNSATYQDGNNIDSTCSHKNSNIFGCSDHFSSTNVFGRCSNSIIFLFQLLFNLKAATIQAVGEVFLGLYLLHTSVQLVLAGDYFGVFFLMVSMVGYLTFGVASILY